jgi:hypothetical protein
LRRAGRGGMLCEPKQHGRRDERGGASWRRGGCVGAAGVEGRGSQLKSRALSAGARRALRRPSRGHDRGVARQAAA